MCVAAIVIVTNVHRILWIPPTLAKHFIIHGKNFFPEPLKLTTSQLLWHWKIGFPANHQYSWICVRNIKFFHRKSVVNLFDVMASGLIIVYTSYINYQHIKSVNQYPMVITLHYQHIQPIIVVFFFLLPTNSTIAKWITL